MIRLRTAIPAAALALTWALAGCGGSTDEARPAITEVAGIAHLEVDEFASLAATPGVVLLDVRTPAEFAGGHLEGATNLDVNDPSWPTQLASLDRAATYALYCQSGNRSGQALEEMASAGFEHAADLSGGIGAWMDDDRPVVGS